MADILAVAGSARRRGNSDTLLEAALEVFRQRGEKVQVVYPMQLTISPCLSCNACFKTGACIQHDEMGPLYERFLEADRIVVATPVYFTNVPGHFKVMIDRFQCFYARTYLEGNPPRPRGLAMALIVGAMHRRRYYDATATVIKSWLAHLNVRTPVVRYYMRLDGPKDVLEHPEMLDDARAAARELIGTTT
jgi:multimeric flavodoxin WrbA